MALDDEVLWHENFDLQSIKTPINADVLNRLLLESNYNLEKREFLVNSFKTGFPLCFEGDKNVRKNSANLKLRIGSKTELWNKLMKEVKEQRIAGPFAEIPFDNYIQSPIGLVPKDGGKKTRLIFHLSHPWKGGSVNAGILKDKCTVKYPDFDEAVKLCLSARKNCKMGKSDLSSAFRHLPMKIADFKFLVMKAEYPKTGKVYYFVDKCLPFGSSISCVHFQEVSNAIAHIVVHRTQ